MFTPQPTRLREHHRSLTTIKATETGWLLPDQQVALRHGGAKNLELKPHCQRHVSSGKKKKAAGDKAARGSGGRGRRLPAAAAVNNSCRRPRRRRRNIASGSHRHADP